MNKNTGFSLKLNLPHRARVQSLIKGLFKTPFLVDFSCREYTVDFKSYYEVTISGRSFDQMVEIFRIINLLGLNFDE